jgi:hypothetical protein
MKANRRGGETANGRKGETALALPVPVGMSSCSSEFLGSNKTLRLDKRSNEPCRQRMSGSSSLPNAIAPKARADGGGRTHTTLRSLDFESSASANSATSA